MPGITGTARTRAQAQEGPKGPSPPGAESRVWGAWGLLNSRPHLGRRLLHPHMWLRLGDRGPGGLPFPVCQCVCTVHPW